MTFYRSLNVLYLLDAMAIVIVESMVNDEQVAAAAVVAVKIPVAVLAFYVVVLVPSVPSGASSAKTTDRQRSLMMVARNRDDD